MSDYASLCLLSYERPDFLVQAIESIREGAHYPFELIVHDDGSTDPRVYDVLDEYRRNDLISTVIVNAPNHNQGVGMAMNRMFQLASGDPIIKLDQDLVFQSGWLARTVDLLEANAVNAKPSGFSIQRPPKEPRIGALGAFHYSHPPVDFRQMFKATHGDKAKWEEHWDFVGSFIAVPADVYRKHGPFEVHSDAFAEDISFKRKLQEEGYALGLPVDDFAVNVGFGPPHSTVVKAYDSETGGDVASIQHGPRVFPSA